MAYMDLPPARPFVSMNPDDFETDQPTPGVGEIPTLNTDALPFPSPDGAPSSMQPIPGLDFGSGEVMGIRAETGEGTVIQLPAASTSVEEPVKIKRKRRTKAELEAARAAEMAQKMAAGEVAVPTPTPLPEATPTPTSSIEDEAAAFVRMLMEKQQGTPATPAPVPSPSPSPSEPIAVDSSMNVAVQWDEQDELLARMAQHATEYDLHRAAAKVEEGKKDEEGAKLKALVEIIGQTMAVKYQLSADMIGRVLLSDPDADGKVLIYRKSVADRTRISAEVLLRLGVSAEAIKEATIHNPVTSWTVDRVNVSTLIENGQFDLSKLSQPGVVSL